MTVGMYKREREDVFDPDGWYRTGDLGRLDDEDYLHVADRVWPVLLFLALIQIVADLCDDAGLFDVSAHVAARVAGGSRLNLFLLFIGLATVSTWVP